ncbi:unnamed protein product [Caenorhabditis auriculariae]|uniref:Macroglobulin domain-containing protein n=1 Tax=Caenorhabditis auriculariae TaxID=2777116 RepID=A0A8S1GNT7_9PELO|nr:unnamed protein product [Caenorhabditis auriculariae]
MTWLTVLSLLLAAGVSGGAKLPQALVVLPPFLRQNSTNHIWVTPVQTDSNVDVKLTLRNGKNQIGAPIKSKAIRPGAPKKISFPLDGTAESVDITIEVTKHEPFKAQLFVRPDLFAVHLHTDKNIYRAGETVKMRALPLTHRGTRYEEPIEIILINAEGFELLRKTKNSDNSPIIADEFELPEHLFFGDWKIIARPSGVKDPQLTFSTSFRVQDYDLPVFKLFGYVHDGGDVEETGITIDARYFHGAPIDGTFTISCSNVSHQDVDRLSRIRVKSGEKMYATG